MRRWKMKAVGGGSELEHAGPAPNVAASSE